MIVLVISPTLKDFEKFIHSLELLLYARNHNLAITEHKVYRFFSKDGLHLTKRYPRDTEVIVLNNVPLNNTFLARYKNITHRSIS